ncbi:TrmH family RNA methyltransferase [Hydrogenimonas sp.]
MVSEARLKRMEDFLRSRQATLRLFLDDIHDPYNHSAIYRSADAAGLFYVDYTRRGDFSVRPRKRVVQGSQRWLAIGKIAYAERLAYLSSWQAKGYRVVATSLGDDTIFYDAIDYTRPTLIVVGNEKEGVGEDLAQAADYRIRIPMRGMAQSLNVSVATAIILFEAARQRDRAGMFERPSLDAATMEHYLRMWIEREERG